jgi:hypothetical protein
MATRQPARTTNGDPAGPAEIHQAAGMLTGQLDVGITEAYTRLHAHARASAQTSQFRRTRPPCGVPRAGGPLGSTNLVGRQLPVQCVVPDPELPQDAPACGPVLAAGAHVFPLDMALVQP